MLYDPRQYRLAYRVVYQDTIGPKKTCTATAAEIWAINAAVEVCPESKRSGWIMMDSQETLRLMTGCGKSVKSGEAVLATLPEVQTRREVGVLVKVLWIPGHEGIVGNERAH